MYPREAEAAEIVASPIGRARRTAEIIRGQIAADGFPRAATCGSTSVPSIRQRDRLVSREGPAFESLPSAGESVVRTGDIG